MILDYDAKQTGPAISPLDSTTLPAGDYGWYGMSISKPNRRQESISPGILVLETADAPERIVSFNRQPWKYSFLEENNRASKYIPEEAIKKVLHRPAFLLLFQAYDHPDFRLL